MLQRAATLSEAYRLLDPLQPLEGERLEQFYAERPEAASIQPLLDELLLDDREDDKTIFTGHRGSGKTTELARLEKELHPSHIAVRMDAESLLNLGDVNYTDLLVIMGLQVFRHAHRSGIRLDKKKLDNLRFWYQTHILEEEARAALDGELEAQLSIGIASVVAKLRTNVPSRERIRAEAQANLSDLLERLNAVLEELRKKERWKAHKVWERDGSPSADRAMLQEVLERRTDPQLLDSQAAQRLVELSGGLLKELIALARNSVLRARRLRGEKGPVQQEDVEYAARQVRNTYRPLLTEGQYRELERIARGERFINTPLAQELLHNLSLLEYDGEEAWWAIHPIVRPLVEEWTRESEGG